jgi:hypothetical protein
VDPRRIVLEWRLERQFVWGLRDVLGKPRARRLPTELKRWRLQRRKIPRSRDDLRRVLMHEQDKPEHLHDVRWLHGRSFRRVLVQLLQRLDLSVRWPGLAHVLLGLHEIRFRALTDLSGARLDDGRWERGELLSGLPLIESAESAPGIWPLPRAARPV